MHIRTVTFHHNKFPTTEYYPFNLDIFNRTDNLDFTSPVTFFIGENGTGKSTLLRAISHKCTIYIWQGIERTRLDINPYENKLYRAIDVEWTDGPVPGSFFASDIFKHFAQVLEDWASTDRGQLDYFGGSSLLTKSHGQSLLAFFEARYRIKGLYLLDEPETALSPSSQLKLLGILTKAARAGLAQFIIATHSPILMACPDAKILSFDHAPIKPVGYEDTDYFKIYKKFMADRNRYLEQL